MVMAPEMAMPKAVPEAMAMPEAVTMAEATMAMTAGESRARDRQRSRGKRESADGGRDDLLDANHEVLLCQQRGDSPCDAPP